MHYESVEYASLFIDEEALILSYVEKDETRVVKYITIDTYQRMLANAQAIDYTLTTKNKEALDLFFNEHLNLSQISERLHVSEARAHQILAKAVYCLTNKERIIETIAKRVISKTKIDAVTYGLNNLYEMKFDLLNKQLSISYAKEPTKPYDDFEDAIILNIENEAKEIIKIYKSLFPKDELLN